MLNIAVERLGTKYLYALDTAAFPLQRPQQEIYVLHMNVQKIRLQNSNQFPFEREYCVKYILFDTFAHIWSSQTSFIGELTG